MTKKEPTKTEKKFDKQEKKYDYRDRDLIHYRKRAEKVIETDLNKRIDKVTKKGFQTKKITKERIDSRDRAYGEKTWQTTFEKRKKGFFYVARNIKTKKIIAKIPEIKEKTQRQHENILRKQLSKTKFDYEKLYVPEDSEPKKKGDKRKGVSTYYNTYYRVGIIIYRIIKGRRYEIIFQLSDSQARSVYVPYQNIVAQLKEDILNATGITLEEWLYLGRTMDNIYIEGGINYKRYKGKVGPNNAWVIDPALDYQVIIDFEEM